MLSKFRHILKTNKLENVLRPLQQQHQQQKQQHRQLTTQSIIEKEDKYVTHNYHPLPVALCKGEGIMHSIYN